MKSTTLFLLMMLSLPWLMSCGGGKPSPAESLAQAEMAYDNANYGTAQQLVDSLVTDENLSHLSTDGLCRLSLLLIRLSENGGNEETNAAGAALALNAAMERDSDSTRLFMANVPVDDMARMTLVQAITNAFHGTGKDFEEDSTYFDNEPIF